jgi:hypothetical protein
MEGPFHHHAFTSPALSIVSQQGSQRYLKPHVAPKNPAVCTMQFTSRKFGGL